MADLNLIVNDLLFISETDFEELLIGIDSFDPVAITELGLIADPLAPVVDIDLSIDETITILESVSLTFDINKSVYDNISVTDFADRIAGLYFINVFDATIILSEIVDVILILNIFVSDDQVSVADEPFQPILTVGNAIAESDIITITEQVTMGRTPLLINVFENITISESTNFGFEIIDISLSETVNILEIVGLSIVLDIEFNDFLRGYPFLEDTITNILVRQFENGSEQRRDKWGRLKKRFGIQFSPRVKTEIDEIREFYENHSGPLTSFQFQNPLDSIIYTVRFEEGSLVIRRVAFDIYQAQVTIVEVF